MSLSVQKALESYVSINELIKQDGVNKWVFPSSTRIKLALNLRKLRPIQEEFTKENTELIKQYGVQQNDEAGKPIEGNFSVDPATEQGKLFRKEQQALLDADSEVCLSPVKAEDLIGQDVPPVTTSDGTVIRAGVRSNQIPVDLITLLFDVGILVEEDQKCCKAE